MKVFFRKKWLVNFFLGMMLACQMASGAQEAYPAKPERPLLLEYFRDFVIRAGQTPLPRLIEELTGFTHLINLLHTAGKPETVIIAASGQASAQLQPDRLRILTTNTLLFPWPFYNDQAERIAEFEKLARSVSPDIIFLQEVWDNKSLQLLLRRFSDYHAVIMPNPLFNLGGLMIFSRIAPVRVTAENFPLTLHHNPEELIARKGILWAEIKLNNRQVWLATTHLYSASGEASFRPNPVQFQHLLKRMQAAPGLVIAGGDMNLEPDELESYLPENILRDDCNLPTAGRRIQRKLDYVLAADTARPSGIKIVGSRVEWKKRFSDHHALLAEVIFSPQP